MKESRPLIALRSNFQLVFNNAPKTVLFDHIVMDHAIRTSREHINSRRFIKSSGNYNQGSSFDELVSEARNLFRPYDNQSIRRAVNSKCIRPEFGYR